MQLKQLNLYGTKLLYSRLRLRMFSFIKKEIDARRDQIQRLPGLMRLYHYAYRILKPRGIILTETQDLRMYVHAADDVITPEILAYGVHEEDETELFKKIIKPSMVIVDIGANIGYYSLLAAKLVGEKGKVYVFEPDPLNYNLLVANIETNHFTNIIPIQKVVSNKAGKVKFFLDKGNFGAHTLSEKNIQTERNGYIEADAITLDGFFKGEKENKVDFIKMDVQGAEGLVIEEALEIIKHNDLKIMMEFWPQGLRNLGTDPLTLLKALHDYGFTIRVMRKDEMHELKKIALVMEVAEEKRYVNLLLEKRHE